MSKGSALVEWAKSVKGRDGKCLDCGSVNDLHAHHIKPKSTHPELRLDLGNGRTLCYSCHKKWHEANRPVRVRSNNPQRRTLLRQIAQLEQDVKDLEAVIRKMRPELMKCKRGCCDAALDAMAKHPLGLLRSVA